jgi:lysophospholipase L1-like esterase
MRRIVVFFRAAAPTCAVLLAVEILLRIGLGAPTGYFDFLAPATRHGLWPANLTQRMDWGPLPSMLHTNELGLRVTRHGPLGSRAKGRIVAIGDSVTHGFFVDDEDTWPFLLQTLLDEELGSGWQVLNAARGGASLPKELTILREIALPLEPTVVLLTFVTNDIVELRDGLHLDPKRHELTLRHENLPLHERAGIWLARRTALGETLLRLYWERFVRTRRVASEELAADRYQIPGGRRVSANIERFYERYAHSQGVVLVSTFPDETRRLVDRYLELLGEFAEESRAGGATPVLIYSAAYPQVYDLSTPMLIRDVLQGGAQRLGMPFLDLTQTLRREGAERVLHMAPLDFHFNPAGNRVIAHAVFEFLRDRNLVR